MSGRFFKSPSHHFVCAVKPEKSDKRETENKESRKGTIL
jgi:hypothetical protein